MKDRIKKKESIVKWDSYELDGKLEDVIAKLQKLITDNPNHFDFTIDVESESGYYGSSSTNINIDAYRWETNQEREERIAASIKASERAKLEAKQREEQNLKREKIFKAGRDHGWFQGVLIGAVFVLVCYILLYIFQPSLFCN